VAGIRTDSRSVWAIGVPSVTDAKVSAYRLGYDYLVEGKGAEAGLGSASLLLYFGVTFTIQRLILMARAQRIADTSPQRTGASTASW